MAGGVKKKTGEHAICTLPLVIRPARMLDNRLSFAPSITNHQHDVNARSDGGFPREEAERVEDAAFVTSGGYDGQGNEAALA